MGSRAEQRFVREALLALGSERPGLREAARAVRDWDRVLSIARAGSVAESIGAAVALRGVEDAVPGAALAAFQEAHEGATARNALLLSEAAAIQAAFTAAGVESVILKGPGLLVAHYPDIGARHVGDVDVLVRARDARRAEAVAAGMTAGGPRPVLLHDGAEVELGLEAGGHATKFFTFSGLALEVHDRAPGGARDGSDVEGVMARARTVSWQGRTLRIPSASDGVVIVCLHVFDAHHGAGNLLLRHLADLSVATRGGSVAWGEEVEGWPPGTGRAALRLSRQLLESGSADGVDAAWHAFSGRAGYAARQMSAREGLVQGGFRILFPTRAFMAARYRVPENSGLLPLLYVWRPIRLAWTLVTGK